MKLWVKGTFAAWCYLYQVIGHDGKKTKTKHEIVIEKQGSFLWSSWLYHSEAFGRALEEVDGVAWKYGSENP